MPARTTTPCGDGDSATSPTKLWIVLGNRGTGGATESRIGTELE